ncbi:MAG: hypothetical protein IJ485_01965 [Lachnospiraceae bacterium]|nr:hypothetical protein [Lachnospiraceae bacterium]
MDCRKVEHSIAQFIRDELDKDEIEKFVNHIYECESCKEELTIQYLIVEGMSRLEEGETFALQEELNAKLEHGRRKAIVRKWMKRTFCVLEIVAVLAAVIMTSIVILR